MNGLRITLAAGVAAAIACTTLSAKADEERGLAVGLRVGYGVPLGNASTHQSFGDFAGGSNPFWFDLGWRFNRHIYAGLFYQFAMMYPPNHACGHAASGAAYSCDGNDQKFGVDVAYHILPKKIVDPWIGLGIGYEWSRINYEQNPGYQFSFQGRGWQYLDIQLGADLRFVDRVPFGPFMDLGLGQFNYASIIDQNAVGKDVNIDSSMHEWFTIGVRGQFNL